jgi:CheY-like chemotaxis protein
VDDEFGGSDVLAAALEDEGFRVFTAANGKRALERLGENVPDVVISDFMMPLMNGAQLGAAMRADPKFRAIPIIMISAVTEESVRERFGGYQAFLRKPFRTAMLLEVIERVLGTEAAKPSPAGEGLG